MASRQEQQQAPPLLVPTMPTAAKAPPSIATSTTASNHEDGGVIDKASFFSSQEDEQKRQQQQQSGSKWICGELRPVPAFYPLEKSSRFVEDSKDNVTARLAECLRVLSVQAEFNSETVRRHRGVNSCCVVVIDDVSVSCSDSLCPTMFDPYKNFGFIRFHYNKTQQNFRRALI